MAALSPVHPLREFTRSLALTEPCVYLTMARSGIAALSFAVLLAVFEIGSCTRCYQCNSQSNKECMDPFSATSKLVDCTTQDSVNYNRDYFRDILPNQLLEGVAGAPRYCTKIVMQSGTTIRTCLDANPLEPEQTCRILKAASDASSGNKQVKHCSVCNKDACNGAGSITASFSVAFLALVASCLYYKQ